MAVCCNIQWQFPWGMRAVMLASSHACKQSSSFKLGEGYTQWKMHSMHPNMTADLHLLQSCVGGAWS